MRNGRDKDNPPSQWAGAISVGHDVYYLFDPNKPAGVVDAISTWHWCTAFSFPDEPGGCWALAHVGKHDLISAEPLHLEPSILWQCCGKHGWIRNGEWIDA